MQLKEPDSDSSTDSDSENEADSETSPRFGAAASPPGSPSRHYTDKMQRKPSRPTAQDVRVRLCTLLESACVPCIH